LKSPFDDPYEEITRLQRCINDLVGVVTLPSVWTGGEPSQIIGTFIDALMRMLSLDIVFVRLRPTAGVKAIEMVRIAEPTKLKAQPHEMAETLNDWFGCDPEKWPPLLQRAIGDADIALVPMRLGMYGETGLIVTGSQRADFPRETERLILRVGTTQAIIGLQEARLRSEQRRIAEELDQRVAQRTIELAAANHELEKEVEERGRAEEALRMRQLQLRLMVDSIPAPIAIMTAAGEVDAVNRPVLDYFGTTLEKLKGWAAGDWVHPDDLPLAIQAWTRAMETGHPYEIESRHRRADGVYRWFHVRGFPLRDTDGHILSWCVLQTDIDDRRKAEEALSANKHNLDLIINTIPTLAWSAHPDGSADFFNQHYLQYVGLSLEQVQNWGWTVAVHPDDLNSLIADWRSMMASCAASETQARLRRFDGEYRWFLFRTNPLRDASGNIVKWFGVNTDIEDRKRAEETLRNTQESLARVARMMTMGELTASIAHEVNQPLSGIITNANTCLRMLAADPPNVEGARETARRTIRDGNRASDVVARLRALFAKKRPTMELLDLNEAVREVIALSSSELKSHRVILRSELAADLPPLIGDRIQLQQVVLNLMRNASDAMSSIEDRPRQLAIRTERYEGDQVRLTVEDTGVGFEAQNEQKLFEAFYTTKSNGIGVGLSVSRSIIGSHGGRLSGQPNQGPGANFSFTIPTGGP